MARYTGPKSRIARKFGDPIYGPDKYLDRKNFPPGQHGMNKKRKKTSEYGLQLREKQKAKYTYGILERQFHNTFEKAQRSKGVTGIVLLQMLEARLDNVVYRLGVAPTRAAARQLVSHRHISVNDHVVNVSSYVVRVGDVIAVRHKDLPSVKNALESVVKRGIPSWIDLDVENAKGVVKLMPGRDDVTMPIREQLIVEYYSR